MSDKNKKPMKEQAMNKTGLKARNVVFKPMLWLMAPAVLAAMDKKQQAQFLANVTQINKWKVGH